MRRHLRYAVHMDDGLVISRCGDELAWPSLDYEEIGRDGNYNAPFTYHLSKISVFAVSREWEWERLRWTKKIPLRIRNLHREFWGLEPQTHNTPAQERWEKEVQAE